MVVSAPSQPFLPGADAGQPGADLRRRRVDQGGAVREHDGGHGLVAAVDRHHVVRRGLVVLDVDLGDLDSGPVELPLQVAAEPAPRGGVHDQLAGHPPASSRSAKLPDHVTPAVPVAFPGPWDAAGWARGPRGTGAGAPRARRCEDRLTDAVTATSADALLAGLDPEQREVALAARGPLCVLAGAGTGKTRAITHRIAYAAAVGLVNPAHVLAVTFTVRAAGEMRGRLRQLGAGQVRASTFHAAALRQLSYFWPRVVGGRPPRLADTKMSLVREAAKQAGLRLDGPGHADAVAEIEWAKATQVRPDGYPAAAAAAGRSPAASAQATAAVYDGYERLRRERHLIDFESVLELTAAIVLEHRAAADQVRGTFRYFVVDEYQDVNPLQKLLLDAWLGDRDDLCVVGDPQQVIYSFTGATPAYLTGFTAEYPGATVVRLVRDYRSTPQVVALANQLLPGGGALVAQRPPGPQPVLTRYGDDASEAAGLVVQIRSLLATGVPAREIAVLVRINADTERFERALDEAGVPYVVRGAERFYERPVVRQVLVLLRGAARGESADDGRDPLPASVRHVLTGVGFTVGPPAGGAAARERWESLAAIAQLADDMHAARPDATLGEFSAELTL